MYENHDQDEAYAAFLDEHDDDGQDEPDGPDPDGPDDDDDDYDKLEDQHDDSPEPPEDWEPGPEPVSADKLKPGDILAIPHAGDTTLCRVLRVDPASDHAPGSNGHLVLMDTIDAAGTRTKSDRVSMLLGLDETADRVALCPSRMTFATHVRLTCQVDPDTAPPGADILDLAAHATVIITTRPLLRPGPNPILKRHEIQLHITPARTADVLAWLAFACLDFAWTDGPAAAELTPSIAFTVWNRHDGPFITEPVTELNPWFRLSLDAPHPAHVSTQASAIDDALTVVLSWVIETAEWDTPDPFTPDADHEPPPFVTDIPPAGPVPTRPGTAGTAA